MFNAPSFTGPSHLSACLGLLLCLLLPYQLAAQTGKSLASFDNICLVEAKRAEAKHGIPTGLLQSITRVESGRKMVTGEYMPWAWTLNDRGEGLFFDSRDAALAYLRDAVAQPDHSVDVGCMQVNTKWHGEGFLDIADMLDPVHNASYAATFLLDLHAAHQSWDEAVKHYHSNEPRKNVAYHRRVLAELEQFMADSGPALSSSGEDAKETASTAKSDDISVMPAPEMGSADLALITRAPAALPDMTPAAEQPGPNSVKPAVSSAVPHPTAPSDNAVAEEGHTHGSPAPGQRGAQDATRDSFLAEQPNLAPHRSRVEHFRQLLARQAG